MRAAQLDAEEIEYNLLTAMESPAALACGQSTPLANNSHLRTPCRADAAMSDEI